VSQLQSDAQQGLGCVSGWPYAPVYAMIFVFLAILFPALCYMATRVPETRGLRRDLFPAIVGFSALLIIGLIVGWLPESTISSVAAFNVRSTLVLLALIFVHFWLVIRPTWCSIRAAIQAADKAASSEMYPSGHSPSGSAMAMETGMATGTRRGFEAVLSDPIRLEEFKRFCAVDLGIAYPIFYSIITRILRGGNDISSKASNGVSGSGVSSGLGNVYSASASGILNNNSSSPSPMAPNAPPPSAATPSSPESVHTSNNQGQQQLSTQSQAGTEDTHSEASTSARSAPRRRRDLHLLHHLHLRNRAPLPVTDISMRTLNALRNQFRVGEVTLASLSRARDECMSRMWRDMYPRFLAWKHDRATKRSDDQQHDDEESVSVQATHGVSEKPSTTSGLALGLGERRPSAREEEMAWMGLDGGNDESGRNNESSGNRNSQVSETASPMSSRRYLRS